MKVVFITPVTPFKENRGGPSGHPYHLMLKRPADIEITVYSYNSNRLSSDLIQNVEQELNVTIKFLKESWWRNWLFKLHLTFIRLFLKYPINYYRRLRKSEVEEIKSLHPDLIWGYSQEFCAIMKQFKEYKRLHTVPDCYSLHFYRRLGLRTTMMNFMERWNVLINYIKHYRMESEYDDSNNIIYHLVGEEDKKFLLEIKPSLNAKFIRHPHYELSQSREIHFHQPKIKLLVAGRYDLYSKQIADELFKLFVSIPEEVRNKLQLYYTITFLGKGWEHHVCMLRHVNYEVYHIRFAPDYIKEITKHDIQLNPLATGTGTKGKVLDALANGLLVIGTPFAMENIAVEHNKSCIVWKHASEVLNILMDIVSNRERYELMAAEGRGAVIQEHNSANISKTLFSLLN
ncbi:MAG: glycosyltransferase family 1 protein [Muribaculaceae bacterium]|nr:glycosyltransferase family 1 protein [Muribaculaceae bacterium]